MGATHTPRHLGRIACWNSYPGVFSETQMRVGESTRRLELPAGLEPRETPGSFLMSEQAATQGISF